MKGEIESVKPTKVTNDLFDHDYVLLATFFDGLVSNDKRANEAYSDLKYLLNIRD
jgi:hypothetical protein